MIILEQHKHKSCKFMTGAHNPLSHTNLNELIIFYNEYKESFLFKNLF
jgi:hypothetical protein